MANFFSKIFSNKNKNDEVEKHDGDLKSSVDDVLELEEIESKVEENKEKVIEGKTEEILEEKAENQVEVEKKVEEKVEEKEEVLEKKTEEVLEKKLEEKTESSKKGFFAKIREGLAKTKDSFTYKLNTVFKNYTTIDEDFLDEIEEILITSDMGVDLTMGIIEHIKEEVRVKKITDPMAIKQVIKDYLMNMLINTERKEFDSNKQKILMVVGVNGVGKTTSIGKLAFRLKTEGNSVIVAAADTFRAAAVEQLSEWCAKADVELVSSSAGADPASVIFDSIQAARARHADILICDTAGRLHNKVNLMNELKKMFKIIDREFGNADREVLLVVDATTGQNGLIQAKMFKETCDIDGIILTKLDGTAKGGIVFPIVKELNVPIKYIGVGEKIDDLQKFDEKMFVDAIFE